jgi:hypothetical protein
MRLLKKGMKSKYVKQNGLTALVLMTVLVICRLLNAYQAEQAFSPLLPSLATGAEKGAHSASTIDNGKPRQKLNRENRILIYITTHMSERHLMLLVQCWPGLLAKSQLFKQADFMMFVTEHGERKANLTLIEEIFAESGITVHTTPNPGYNEGAVLAVTEAFENHWFDAYDWVIRLNPDVLIRNDTFLLDQMNDIGTHGIFDDCWDVSCPKGNKCIGRLIHTDFFAVRPHAIPSDAFAKAKEREEHAETMATDAFSSIVSAGADSWLPGTGPHLTSCRVTGESSPVIHTHEIDAVYPACLSWYD